MDESWRRRHPAIQPNHVTGYLGPDDFRDVFGGPPRSVFLRHYSHFTQHDGQPHRTNLGKPEFVSTIRCGRNGFVVTKRETERATKKVFYKPKFAASVYAEDHEKLPSYDASRNLHHMSRTSFGSKREDISSFTPTLDKQGELLTASGRVMERENGTSHNTNSDLNSPTTCYAHNKFQDTKSEVDAFSEDAIVYSPISGQCPMMHNRLPFMKCELDDLYSKDADVYSPISGQWPMMWSSNSAFHPLRREEGFFDDIFGLACGDSEAGLRRSRSRSIFKSGSGSTAVSCYEDRFLANSANGDEDDRALSSFASKLRPITIPSKRYDSTPPSTISEGDGHDSLRYVGPANPSSPVKYFKESSHSSNSNHPNTRNRCGASNFCCFAPPETLSVEPSFRMSFKKPPSLENLPSSVSLPYKVKEVEKKIAPEVFDSKTEERKFGSEVNAALDEAIAWAKNRFMMQDNISESKNENYVGLKNWNGTAEKYIADSKER